MRYADGARVATRIFEAAAWQYAIRVTCAACGHSSVLDPHALWWRFYRKGWDERLDRAGARLRCRSCGASGATLMPTRDAVTVDELPLPPVNEWKRAINRFRG